MAIITPIQGYTQTQPITQSPLSIPLSSLASRYTPQAYTSTAPQLPILYPPANSLTYYRPIAGYSGTITSITSPNINIDS